MTDTIFDSNLSISIKMFSSAAIVVLNQNSVSLARKIATMLPKVTCKVTIYGLVGRTSGVDVSFDNFGETLRQLFTDGVPIIGICAAGILIRTLAPIISDKRQEPPVLAIAEDGSAVVPLLGGLRGVNDLARQVAAGLGVEAAITTAGDIRFRTALLSPPQGYELENPEAAKGFIADLLAGAKVKLEGKKTWLWESKLPIDEEGELRIWITASQTGYIPNCLVYHPKTIALGIGDVGEMKPEDVVSVVRQILDAAELAIASLAGLFVLQSNAASPSVNQVAKLLNLPLRILDLENNQTSTSLVLAATNNLGRLLVSPIPNIAVAVSEEIIDTNNIGKPRGKLSVVGTGPGASEWMSPEVKQILREATDLVGYSFYLDLAGTLQPGQQRHDSDNREELARAKMALDLAAAGKNVAVVSSGDPGIYAMAAAIFEVLDTAFDPAWQHIQVQVCPGISAIQAAAARIGAPIGHDFCVISLSNILKSWSIIERRIIAAAEADLVIAFYNPASKQRRQEIISAYEILKQYRSPETPVVIARNLGRDGESIEVVRLNEFKPDEVDMRSLILIGSSQTRVVNHPGGVWVYTPRHYKV
jgi:cobalt-precorrin 5A hydrolase / precorrin-3B C17-methyltransferase